MLTIEYSILDAEYLILDARFWILDAGYLMLDIQNPGTSIQFQDMISKDQMICLSGEFDTLCRESLTNADFGMRNAKYLFF